MRRIYSLVSILAMLALLITACTPVAPAESGAEGVAPAATAIRMGTQPWIGYGPWWIAAEKGFFEAEGLDVTFIDFVTDSEVNAAFAANQMDVANIASHTAMKLFANGVDLQVVLLEDASYAADAILAGAGITTIGDLAGKSVAYEEGATSDLLLHAALQANEMSLEEINPVPMPASDAGAALIAGQVDAAVTYEPYISAALAQEPALTVLYSGADNPGLISDVLAVNAPFGEANEEAMRRLMTAWNLAVDYLRANPDEGRAIIAAAVGSSAEELATAFDGVVFYDRSENIDMLGEGQVQTFNTIAEGARMMGLIEEAPDFQRMINPNYLR
jgi:NitT/TauT family transport system substrate-binding protein